MKLLIIGGGGREHALAWKLAQSPQCTQLWLAPGNPGMAELGTCLPLAADDIDGLLAFARAEQIDLTVVGPERPLSLGLVDRFTSAGLAAFGPTQAAARLESSKAFAKAVMKQANIPTAAYRHAQTIDDAYAALDAMTPPYVVKEDGLAAGKGVTIATDRAMARAAVKAAFAKGMTVVIEAFLHGQELSILALCDGERAIPLVSAQDFKRVGAGDTGPNTGGMGAYAPVPWVTPALMASIQTQVLTPVLQAMAAMGCPYRGVLYAGLMISPEGHPFVVEFNARFGDPETQVVLPLLDEDLLPLLSAAATGNLRYWEASGVALKPGSAVTVVLASNGYPGVYKSGGAIKLPPLTQHVDTMVFHAGTRQDETGILTAQGGRVLNATAWAGTLASARADAYRLLQAIEYNDGFYRADIAETAVRQPCFNSS